MALLRTRFKAFGRTFQFTLDTKKFSRNYGDENYAYWIRCTHGHVFEINIWKAPAPSDDSIAEEMVLTDTGLVICYKNEQDFEDDRQCEEHKISFKRA